MNTNPIPRDLTKEIATVAKDLTYPAFGGIMRPSDDVLALKGGSRGLAIYDDLELSLIHISEPTRPY